MRPKKTLHLFGNDVIDGFDGIFISPVDFWLKFDNYVQYHSPSPNPMYEDM